MNILLLCDDYWHPAEVIERGLQLLTQLEEGRENQDWQVLRVETGHEEYVDSFQELDMLVMGTEFALSESDMSNFDGRIGDGLDYDRLEEVISERIWAVHTLMEACLPALRAGRMKRIAILTKRSASITNCTDCRDYAKHVIMAAINMKTKFLFCRLRSEGFTIRCFAEEDKPEQKDIAGRFCAGEYFLQKFSLIEREPAIHSEENRLVMRDSMFREIAW